MPDYRELVRQSEVSAQARSNSETQKTLRLQEEHARTRDQLIARFFALGLRKDFEDIYTQVWQGVGTLSTTPSSLCLRAEYPVELWHHSLAEERQPISRKGIGPFRVTVIDDTGWADRDSGVSTPDTTHTELRVGPYLQEGYKVTGYRGGINTAREGTKVSQLSLKFDVLRYELSGDGFCELQVSDTEVSFYHANIDPKIADSSCGMREYIQDAEMSAGKYFTKETRGKDDENHAISLLFTGKNFDEERIRAFLKVVLVQSCKSRINRPLPARVQEGKARIQSARAQTLQEEARIKARVGEEYWDETSKPLVGALMKNFGSRKR